MRSLLRSLALIILFYCFESIAQDSQCKPGFGTGIKLSDCTVARDDFIRHGPGALPPHHWTSARFFYSPSYSISGHRFRHFPPRHERHGTCVLVAYMQDGRTVTTSSWKDIFSQMTLLYTTCVGTYPFIGGELKINGLVFQVKHSSLVRGNVFPGSSTQPLQHAVGPQVLLPPSVTPDSGSGGSAASDPLSAGHAASSAFRAAVVRPTDRFQSLVQAAAVQDRFNSPAISQNSLESGLTGPNPPTAQDTSHSPAVSENTAGSGPTDPSLAAPGTLKRPFPAPPRKKNAKTKSLKKQIYNQPRYNVLLQK